MNQDQSTDQLRKSIQQMYDEGATVKDMCQKLGFSKAKIDYHRKALGLMAPKPQLEISGETFARIQAMVRKGIGYATIARQVNLSAHTVRRIIHNKSSGRSISDVLKDPINHWLARRWS